MLSNHSRFVPAVAFALVLVSVFPFLSTHAATIPVDTVSDTVEEGFCSLRAALEAANTDSAVAGCPAGSEKDTVDLAAIAGQTIILTSGELSISNAVEIVGADVEIDATRKSRIFNIIGPGAISFFVSLQDLRLTNGLASQPAKGGCISVEYTRLIIRGITIFNCGAGGGGGIYAFQSVMSLVRATISASTAGNHGGGIYSNGGSMSISASDISDNGSGIDGGGLYLAGNSASIGGSRLSGNTAVESGGGILLANGSLDISNATSIDNNEAAAGGGMAQFGGVADITDSLFQGNFATGKGGGIHLSAGEINFTNAILSSNATEDQGGGLYQHAGTVRLTSSRIEQNTAPGSGGGIFVAGGEQSISYSTLAGNESGGNGGAIFSRSVLSLSSSTLSDNTAAVRGGGLYAWKKVTDPTIITNSTLSVNYAELGGGALVVDEAVVSVYNSTITQNTSSDLNGAASVWITNDGSFTLVNSILYNPADSQNCEINGGAGSTLGIGVNLVEQAANCDFTAGLVIPGDPLLGLLHDNGGPTLTHLPLADSPVINVGSNTDVPDGVTRDQRGPFYLRIDGGSVELGAVEVTSALPQVIFADSLEQ